MSLKHWLLVLAGAVALIASPALARPEYAEKEKKECAFCHVSPAGGGARNAHGIYYAQNSHSLKGLPASFKLLWKLAAPAEARRVGLGNVLDTKKPHVLLLGAGDELTVYELADEQLTKKAALKLGPRSGDFVVGRFQKDKPAIVAVPGALYHWNGSDFQQTKASGLAAISGAVRFVEGDECVFHFDGMNDPTVFGVQLGATNPLVVGPSMVLPDQGAGVYAWIVARLAPDVVSALGWPAQIAKSPVLGVWDPRQDNTLRAWAIWSEGNSSKLVLADPASLMYGGSVKPTWSSEPIEGKVLDVTIGLDPKDGKVPGFLVLAATGAEGKERTLLFFGLD